MGATGICGGTRAEHVAEALAAYGTIVAKKTVGSNVFLVYVGRETGKKRIGVVAIESYKDRDRFGSPVKQYLYKTFDESEGPCVKGCPAEFLDLADPVDDVPEGRSDFAGDFRGRVRAEAAAKSRGAQIAAQARPGDTLELTNGQFMRVVAVPAPGSKKRQIRAVSARGTTYRIPEKMIVNVLKKAELVLASHGIAL